MSEKKPEQEAAKKSQVSEKEKQEIFSAAKEAALAELKASLGISDEQIEQVKKSQKPVVVEIMAIDIGSHVVRINGVKFTGSFKVPADIGEVIVEMVNRKRARLLREMVRHEYQIQQLRDGGYKAVLLKKEQGA